jgi:hypothetical protein
MSEAIAIIDETEPEGGVGDESPAGDSAADDRAAEDSPAEDLPERTHAFYRGALEALNAAGVPYLVAGAYAFARYTGIQRHTKDFDIFVRQEDEPRIHRVLAEQLGCEIERFSPHWLSKATCGADFIDIIHSSGNAVAEVDERWIAHAVEDEVLGVPVRLCPVEEMIWSKAFIMERERFDGADVAHLLHDCAGDIDWARLLERFGEHWRVLYSHLVLFGFIYPTRRGSIPEWVMQELGERLARERATPPPALQVCRGTVLSRSQYVVDVEERGYRDGRLAPAGNMSRAEIEEWQRRAEEDQAKALAAEAGG